MPGNLAELKVILEQHRKSRAKSRTILSSIQSAIDSAFNKKNPVQEYYAASQIQSLGIRAFDHLTVKQQVPKQLILEKTNHICELASTNLNKLLFCINQLKIYKKNRNILNLFNQFYLGKTPLESLINKTESVLNSLRKQADNCRTLDEFAEFNRLFPQIKLANLMDQLAKAYASEQEESVEIEVEIDSQLDEMAQTILTMTELRELNDLLDNLKFSTKLTTQRIELIFFKAFTLFQQKKNNEHDSNFDIQDFDIFFLENPHTPNRYALIYLKNSFDFKLKTCAFGDLDRLAEIKKDLWQRRSFFEPSFFIWYSSEIELFKEISAKIATKQQDFISFPVEKYSPKL